MTRQLTIDDMIEGRYYLVKNHGTLNVAIVRAGKKTDEKKRPANQPKNTQKAYMGRCLIFVSNAGLVREASKLERHPMNASVLYREVYGPKVKTWYGDNGHGDNG